MINKIRIKFVLLVVPILLTCCKKKNVSDFSRISHPKSIISPSDGKFLFDNLDELTIADNLIDSLQDIPGLDLAETDIADINQWITDTVFSEKSGDRHLLEFNINDDGFCKDFRSTLVYANDKSIKTDTTICNSRIPKNFSAGNGWNFKNKSSDLTISIYYCCSDLRYIKRVGYYEVVLKNDEEEFEVFPTLKYRCNTQIYIVVERTDVNFFHNNLIIKEFVLAKDSTNLYSFAHMW